MCVCCWRNFPVRPFTGLTGKHMPSARYVPAWTRAPSQQWLWWLNGSLLDSCTYHSQARFPQCFEPRFPMTEYQMSHFIKPLSPGTGTQKQLSWCSWGRTPDKGIPLAFIPHIHPTSFALPPEPLVPAPSLCPSTLLGSLVFICFGIQRVSNSQLLLCHPVSVHLAGVTNLLYFLLPQKLAIHGLFSQVSTQSSACISICISVCKLSYLDQNYSSPTWGIW